MTPILMAVQSDPLALRIDLPGQRLMIPLDPKQAEQFALALIAGADSEEKGIIASDERFLQAAGVAI